METALPSRKAAALREERGTALLLDALGKAGRSVQTALLAS